MRVAPRVEERGLMSLDLGWLCPASQVQSGQGVVVAELRASISENGGPATWRWHST